ncbi:hypothetical protein C0J52_18003 [Blattella germanica]|nr:hypothetical protein C0J52_18003 [Blattella germanica]
METSSFILVATTFTILLSSIQCCPHKTTATSTTTTTVKPKDKLPIENLEMIQILPKTDLEIRPRCSIVNMTRKILSCVCDFLVSIARYVVDMFFPGTSEALVKFIKHIEKIQRLLFSVNSIV